MRNRLISIAALVGLVIASPSQAGHHLWDFTELYSNASGSVQFMELFTAVNSEAGVGPFTITSGANTFSFGTNLSTATTANTWILIATSNFASQGGGITPDYIIPANFFSTGGGTVNYASGVDVWNYGAVPVDGVHSLQRDGSTAVNSPRNFAGASGSVNLSVAAPMLSSWAIILLIGGLLLVASGLLRRRQAFVA